MAGMEKTKYINEFIKDKYHRLSLNVKKAEYDRLKHFSEKENLTVTGFVRRAYEREMRDIETGAIKKRVPHQGRIEAYMHNGTITDDTPEEFVTRVVKEALDQIKRHEEFKKRKHL